MTTPYYKSGSATLASTAMPQGQYNHQVMPLSSGGPAVIWMDLRQGVAAGSGDISGRAITAQVFAGTVGSGFVNHRMGLSMASNTSTSIQGSITESCLRSTFKTLTRSEINGQTPPRVIVGAGPNGGWNEDSEFNPQFATTVRPAAYGFRAVEA